MKEVKKFWLIRSKRKKKFKNLFFGFILLMFPNWGFSAPPEINFLTPNPTTQKFYAGSLTFTSPGFDPADSIEAYFNGDYIDPNSLGTISVDITDSDGTKLIDVIDTNNDGLPETGGGDLFLVPNTSLRILQSLPIPDTTESSVIPNPPTATNNIPEFVGKIQIEIPYTLLSGDKGILIQEIEIDNRTTAPRIEENPVNLIDFYGSGADDIFQVGETLRFRGDSQYDFYANFSALETANEISATIEVGDIEKVRQESGILVEHGTLSGSVTVPFIIINRNNQQVWVVDIALNLDNANQDCSGGTFTGATGTGGIFKVGDSLQYLPFSGNVGQNFTINLSSLGLDTQVPAGEAVVLPEGSVDGIGLTFTVTGETLTGNQSFTCQSSPISVDNILPTVASFGSIDGATGNGGAFKIGDSITYHAPLQNDNETFSVDFSPFGGDSQTLPETPFSLLESNFDLNDLSLDVTITDDAGNQTVLPSDPLTIDLVRPIFPDNFLENGIFLRPSVSQATIDDPRFDGWVEKFWPNALIDDGNGGTTTDLTQIEKSVWGNGDLLEILLPSDDAADEQNPLVTVDLSDISIAGNISQSQNPAELNLTLNQYFSSLYTDVSEISGFVDLSNYQKNIVYTDDVGNEPAGNLTLQTNPLAIDLVAPQVPDEYSALVSPEGKLLVIIGDLVNLETPFLDTQGDTIRYSADLNEIGGNTAKFLFVTGNQSLSIASGVNDSLDDYFREIHYFDKAFNLVSQNIKKIIVDNEVPVFDASCGGQLLLQDFSDLNGIGDFANQGPDNIIFQAPLKNVSSCDFERFGIDLSPISGSQTHNFERVSADGQVFTIPIGAGEIDQNLKSFVLKIYDTNGNSTDYSTNGVNLDNEVVNAFDLSDRIEFKDYNTPDENLYLAQGDDISINLSIADFDDIVQVLAKVEGAFSEIDLVQNQTEPFKWYGDTTILGGDFFLEPKFVSYIIIDDAGNRIVLEGEQKIFFSNKSLSSSPSSGGTGDIHRPGFKNRHKVTEPNRGSRRINSNNYTEDEILDIADRIRFLQENDFELTAEQRNFLKKESLKKRLNYIQTQQDPQKNLIKKGSDGHESYFDRMKKGFVKSRQTVREKNKNPNKLKFQYLKFYDPGGRVKNWEKYTTQKGEFKTHNTLKNLKKPKASVAPQKLFENPGTLRKSHIMRGIQTKQKFGVIIYR